MARTGDADLNAAVRGLRDVAAKLRDEYGNGLFSWAQAPFGGDGTLCAILLRGGESQPAAVQFIQNVCAVARGDVDDEEGVGHGFLPLADPLDGTGATARLLSLGVADMTVPVVVSRTDGLRAFRIDASEEYTLAVVAVSSDLREEDVYASNAAAEFAERRERDGHPLGGRDSGGGPTQ